MTYYNLPNNTSTGADQIIIDLMSEVNVFTPMLLFFTFFVVFLGGIINQKQRTGTSDYSMWATVASISMLMVSLIMSMVSGFINLPMLVVVVVITIFSGVWLFLDRKPSEGI